MRYLLGLGEYGSSELFGSVAVTALYVPSIRLPGFRKLYKDLLGQSVDDYQAFEIVKGLFPNYQMKHYNLVDWFNEPHYYEVGVPNETHTGVMNFMTDDSTFLVETLDHIIMGVYVPDVAYLNDLLSTEMTIGAASYMLINNVADAVLKEVNDIYETAEPGLYPEPPSRINYAVDEGGDVESCDQFIADYLATLVSRVAYLAQIQKLESQCHASLPRGISKQANDFYLTRCAKMEPEHKKLLFKVRYMEDDNNA